MEKMIEILFTCHCTSVSEAREWPTPEEIVSLLRAFQHNIFNIIVSHYKTTSITHEKLEC